MKEWKWLSCWFHLVSLLALFASELLAAADTATNTWYTIYNDIRVQSNNILIIRTGNFPGNFFFWWLHKGNENVIENYEFPERPSSAHGKNCTHGNFFYNSIYLKVLRGCKLSLFEILWGTWSTINNHVSKIFYQSTGYTWAMK